MRKLDPLGREFYIPLRKAEVVHESVFAIAAVLSVLSLLIDKQSHPTMYDVVQTAFVVAVIAVFALGTAIRLYWSPRAHVERMADFLSHSFRARLIATPSVGYYSSDESDTYRRIAAQLLENTFFSKAILASMLLVERSKVIIYAIVWLVAALNRQADLAVIGVVAQVLFSEHILSQWVRMEWLRARVERVYSDLFALFCGATNAESAEFKARVVDSLLRYETGKAQAGVSLSSRVFKNQNAQLTEHWAHQASSLGIR